MSQTPDRFPGEREDEGLILENNPAGDPPIVGGLRFFTNRFRFRDNLGPYTGRPVYDSTTNPTAASDSSAGFNVGMLWVNTVTSIVYICRVDTVASAVWVPLNPGVAFPPATEVGQLFASTDGATFSIVLPVVSPDDGWLSNADGELLLEGLDP